uniref:Amine oxidase n=1 Tax=Denticeps clupeoides TaxID=299321 RepID=A0AAY4AUN0_9TELE
PDGAMFDVVVVGAGLSGLSAAELLLRRDARLRVLVLEGKGRVGGRTLTQELPAANGPDLWDLGGQWVGSSQTHVMNLIEELGIEVYPQYTEGKKVHHMGGPAAKVRTYTGSIPSFSPLVLLDFSLFLWKINRLSKSVSVEDPLSSPNALLYDSMTLASFVEKNIWTRELKEELGLCTRAVFGMEPSQMSFLYFLMYSAAAGGVMRLLETSSGSAQEFKIKGGAQHLSERLAERVGRECVRLGSPVTAIWQVTVQSGERGGVTEREALLPNVSWLLLAPISPPQIHTVSLSSAAKLHYQPALPAGRQRLMQCMPVGHMLKFIITYPTAFWREKGFSGEIVARPSKDCPLSATFDATTPKGNAALVGFIAGVQACDWSVKKKEERRDAVVSSLVKYLGPEASAYIQYVEKDWSEEEYNGGCPVNVMVPGMLTFYHPSLRSPCGRVYWAGTETATQWCGYMSGAIQSGQRAALQVLARLSPDCLSQEDRDAAQALENRHKKPASSTGSCCFRAGLALMVLAVGADKSKSSHKWVIILIVVTVTEQD